MTFKIDFQEKKRGMSTIRFKRGKKEAKEETPPKRGEVSLTKP